MYKVSLKTVLAEMVYQGVVTFSLKLWTIISDI